MAGNAHLDLTVFLRFERESLRVSLFPCCFYAFDLFGLILHPDAEIYCRQAMVGSLAVSPGLSVDLILRILFVLLLQCVI